MILGSFTNHVEIVEILEDQWASTSVRKNGSMV